jgi:hypothetical protein
MQMTIRGDMQETGGMAVRTAVAGTIPAAPLASSLILGGLLLLIGP